jgi:hypothetical protein
MKTFFNYSALPLSLEVKLCIETKNFNIFTVLTTQEERYETYSIYAIICSNSE